MIVVYPNESKNGKSSLLIVLEPWCLVTLGCRFQIGFSQHLFSNSIAVVIRSPQLCARYKHSSPAICGHLGIFYLNVCFVLGMFLLLFVCVCVFKNVYMRI